MPMMMGGWSWRVYGGFHRIKSFEMTHFQMANVHQIENIYGGNVCAHYAQTPKQCSQQKTTPLITSLCCKSIRCRNDLFYRWIFAARLHSNMKHVHTYTQMHMHMHMHMQRTGEREKETPKKRHLNRMHTRTHEISLQECKGVRTSERVNAVHRHHTTQYWWTRKTSCSTRSNNIVITKSLQLRFDFQRLRCYKYFLINARLIGCGKYEENKNHSNNNNDKCQ